MTAVPPVDDADRAILLECPIDILVVKGQKISLAATNRMTRIKRLWSQGYVHGAVEQDKHYPGRQTLKITLREKGREALQVTRS